jgi:hypothetical protein
MGLLGLIINIRFCPCIFVTKQNPTVIKSKEVIFHLENNQICKPVIIAIIFIKKFETD